jgi:hypothetical protein
MVSDRVPAVVPVNVAVLDDYQGVARHYGLPSAWM